ncbi:hypothetical protein M2158_004851 [Streptomyces sp. SAI-144]|nr:hypothetical protein [Streptomyces sp. SAI-144]
MDPHDNRSRLPHRFLTRTHIPSEGRRPAWLGGVEVPRGPAALGAPGASGRRRPGGPALLLEHHDQRIRSVLRRRRPQHVGELGGVLLRRAGPGRHPDHRQARRIPVAAGTLRPRLRLPRMVPDAPPGRRGRCHGARHLPGGAALVRSRTGSPRRRHHDPDPRAGVHVRALDGGRRADHVPGPGRRRLSAGRARSQTAPPAGGRCLDRAGLPGQDAAGLGGPAGPRPRLPATGPRTLAPQDRSRPGRRRGHGRGLAVLGAAPDRHAGLRSPLRRRHDRQQRRHHGVRLQRLQPFSPTTW